MGRSSRPRQYPLYTLSLPTIRVFAPSSGPRAALSAPGNAQQYPANVPQHPVFLAADRSELQSLEEAARQHVAWQSILRDEEQLGLTTFQKRQVEQKLESTASTIAARMPETYKWRLLPVQNSAQSPLALQAIRLSGQDPLAVRANKKLRGEEQLIAALGSAVLRMKLDEIPLWQGEHVPGGPTPARKPRHSHSTVDLNPERIRRDASKIAKEVITHLVGIMRANVRVILEIAAEIPDGAPDQVVRTVTENGRTLKVSNLGFENE